tara:strand:+ start:14356 stop:16161 length:1806 start_codon:yes stop_codon:yes gene_type:complete
LKEKMSQKTGIISTSLFLFRSYEEFIGNKIYLILSLTIIAVILEGFGFTLLMPLIESLGGEINDSSSIYLDLIDDYLLLLGPDYRDESLLLLMCVIFLLKGIFIFLAGSYKAFLMAEFVRSIKSSMFRGIVGMNYLYYTESTSGHFVNILNTQVNISIKAFGSFITMLTQLVMTVVYIIMALIVALKFGILILLIGSFLLLLFRSLNAYLNNLSNLIVKQQTIQSKLSIDFLQSLVYLKSTNQTKKISDKFNNSISTLKQFDTTRGVADSFTNSIREPLAVLIILFILYYEVVFIGNPLAPLLVSILFIYRGLSSANTVQHNFQMTIDRMGALRSVIDELGALKLNTERDGIIEKNDFNYCISFQRVSYGYQSEYILQDLNFEIKKNQSVAFVGKSGSGKSTILNLITLALEPNKGTIKIDGVDAANLRKSLWRGLVGYVSQESAMFNDTVENNITLWQEDANFQEVKERIIRVCKEAHIHDFIMSLPEGYKTNVGDRAIKLSGGQRQRLFIARELFREPEILIFDEATSALDGKTEVDIQKTLDGLKEKITLIIVAHRLSTIKNVDNIHVIKDKTIVESGTYQELSKNQQSSFKEFLDPS